MEINERKGKTHHGKRLYLTSHRIQTAHHGRINKSNERFILLVLGLQLGSSSHCSSNSEGRKIFKDVPSRQLRLRLDNVTAIQFFLATSIYSRIFTYVFISLRLHKGSCFIRSCSQSLLLERVYYSYGPYSAHPIRAIGYSFVSERRSHLMDE